MNLRTDASEAYVLRHTVGLRQEYELLVLIAPVARNTQDDSERLLALRNKSLTYLLINERACFSL